MGQLKYFELFAGTGIAGMGIETVFPTAECVGYSEIDPYAVKNYDENHPSRLNYGDITKINEKTLPDFDILVFGSPCTDISQANSKGVKGLKGEQSSLFYDSVRILNYKRPKWFMFENVRNLLYSNKGEDLKIVLDLLSENYTITYKVVDTKDYGVPQTRKRIYILGQLKELGVFDYNFPPEVELTIKAQDLLEPQVSDKYYLSEKMRTYVLDQGEKRYNFSVKTDLDIACTLVSTMHKMHRAGIDNYYHTEYRPKGKTNLRRLTPRECARLQGLPDTYKIVVSDTQAYRLFGNAMSLNVVTALMEQLKMFIENNV